MQGIILAAGMGKRLKYLTNNNTKCMIKVNGQTLIERALRMLDKKNLSRIIIVVGYKADVLINHIDSLNISTPILYVNNPIYETTNNIYSLALTKKYLCSEDTILLESDLIFQEEVLDAILDDKRPNLALVDKFESWMDGTCMEIDEEDCITDFIPGKYLSFSEKDHYYKTVNIYKFSTLFSQNIYIPFLTAYQKAMGENEYYESVIKMIAMLETKEIRVKRLSGQIWYEIDNIQDLNIAESLFSADDDEHYTAISSRYGGYWRYPKLLDFCYLVNPYYPPVKMMDEMKSNFEILLTSYPSGMDVNSLDVSGVFGVKQSHIVVGNGAAELIKSLMNRFISDDDFKIGCVSPTFEEYPNRFDKERTVRFVPETDGFRYTCDDLINYFDGKAINALILINPDNPSGNYLMRDDVIRLIKWAKKKDISLVVDESFVDFSEEVGEAGLDNVTLINESALNLYEHLYVVKSISKSYGVPGARLGVLVSSDKDMISYIKKDVSIWNINSFGEFFIQIKEKYDKDYIKSLSLIRDSRNYLVKLLSEIDYLTVYPSQANYVLCRLKDGLSSRELCNFLLRKNVFIKDITPKIKDGHQYVRVAVRTKEENKILAESFKDWKKG